MRISCTHCGKNLGIPDDKVPAKPFALTCPSCQKRFRVDPAEQERGTAPAAAAEAPAGAPAEPVGPPGPPQEPPGAAAPGSEELKQEQEEEAPPPPDRPLPRLRPQEASLLASIESLAYVVNLGVPPEPRIATALEQLGIAEVREFDDLAAAVEANSEIEAGILVIRMDKASAPPCEPLAPLGLIPFGVRRRIFVALMAPNVATLDGMVAFLLQVNCLIKSSDLPRLPYFLRRALLYHLRLYQHWDMEVG